MESINEIYLETYNLKACLELVTYGLETHSINAMLSRPGLGKTVSIYYSINENPNNIVKVKVETSTTPRIFYSTILNKISDEKYDAYIPLNLLIKRVANMFVSMNCDMLLLIDEVTKFEHNFFEHLQDFWELTKVNTGIVLAGGDYFIDKFKKWSENTENGMPEFYSRIERWIELKKPSKSEIISIINAYDIYDNQFEYSCFDVESFRELVRVRINHYLQKHRNTFIAQKIFD